MESRWPTRAPMEALTPSMILRKSPWCLPASARVESLPSTAALESMAASATRAPTASMQALKASLMRSKSPWEVSAILVGMSPREMRVR